MLVTDRGAKKRGTYVYKEIVSSIDSKGRMLFVNCLFLVTALATAATCYGETCKFTYIESDVIVSHLVTASDIIAAILYTYYTVLVFQVNSAPIISLATARMCTVVAAPPLECIPLTQVVVGHSRCSVIWTDSRRSSRGEWTALLTSTATGPAMSMALVTLLANTGGPQEYSLSHFKNRMHPAQSVPIGL